MKKALYIIVIMILIIAFCVSAFLVARYVLEGKKQADRYEDLANIKNQAQTSVPTVDKALGHNGTLKARLRGHQRPHRGGRHPSGLC